MTRGGPYDCVLLNACGAAYDVAAGSTTFVPDTVFSPHVPYLRPPQVACNGPGLINAATVGQCPFGIVVAFRGTISPTETDPDSWMDWLNDFFAVPYTSNAGPFRLPGQVHRGFFDATTSIVEQVHALVVELSPGRNNPVFITGHSKGGPMATMAAMILGRNLGLPGVEPVVTFASPRPGDVAFRQGCDAVLRQIRYENHGDIVPLVPPSLTWFEKLVSELIGGSHIARRLHDLLLRARDWNYVPVGEKLFITRHGTVTPGEPEMLQEIAIVAEVTEDLFSGNFSSFARAHSLAPGGGYNLGVCGTSASDTARRLWINSLRHVLDDVPDAQRP